MFSIFSRNIKITVKNVGYIRNFMNYKNSLSVNCKQQQLNQLFNSSYSRYSASTIMSPHCKEFRFTDYDLIGFDLDGTLLRYNLSEMIPLEYELLRTFLVEQKGYPRALLNEKKLDNDFLQKGLVLDTDKGNILKLSADAKILRATHGTKLLTTAQICEIYGEDRKWSIASQFFEDPLSTWNGPLSEKLRTLLDYFDFAVSIVFGQAVDVLDAEAKAKGSECQSPYKVWSDMLECLIQIYTRENFSNGRSAYFNALRANPDRYLMRTSKCVIELLRELRASGKAVFLLTGSDIDFAHFTASYALGEDWRSLFDNIVCFAKKPGFFTIQRPFLRVENHQEIPGSQMDLDVTLPLNTAYTQGNWKQLRATLAKHIGKSPEQVRSLYVGDNLIQDVYTPVKHHDLDVVAVCEEMLADEGAPHAPHYEFNDVLSSSFWGSYFSLDNEPTLWSKIIADYSQLCIPLMDSAAKSPVTHRFFCENAAGYYPQAPEILSS